MRKERRTSMTEKRKVGVIAFGLPILLVMILMLLMRQYPFGDHSLLIWDMDWQYSAFFVHLRDIMHGEASLWYSFSRAIGGDMIGVAAYYLISPFNLLFYFFDASNIYAGIALVLLLKIGTTGWAMNTYLYQKHHTADTVIFSTAYALSGFIAGYFFNMIWLDGIILLPLMVLGIERLVEKSRCLLYIAAIALGVITSFYIGYMLCIFSVLYFGCYFFFMTEQKKKIKTIVLYIVSSLFGGALSACVALPTVYAMQGGKSAIDLRILKNFTKLYEWKTLITKSFIGATSDLQITSGYPLIYCGVLALLLGLTYFGLKEITWKRKLAYFLLLAALLVSMNLYNLCSAWQAFNMPNGSPYRFAFLYTFVLLLVSAETYARLSEIFTQADGTDGKVTWKEKLSGLLKEWNIRSFLAADAILLLVLALIHRDFILMGHVWLLAMNAVMLLIYLAVVMFVKKKGHCGKVLLALIGVELCVNAASLYHYSPLYEDENVSEYRDYVEQVSVLADGLKKEEGLFRTVLEKDAYRTVNDSMLFNLYGLDSYTSVERNSTQNIAFQLGYYTNMVFGIHYKEGGTQAAESLLGVKYLITSKEPECGYELLQKNGNLGLYENKNALRTAVMADGSIMAASNEEYNTFAYQNVIYSGLCEELGIDVFVPLERELNTLDNCVQNADGSFSLKDPQKTGWVEYRISVQEEGHCYLQGITAETPEIIAVVNGDRTNLTEMGNVVKRLGYLKPEDEVLIRCRLEGEGEHRLENVLVYREDADALSAYAARLGEQQVEIVKEREDKFTVICNNTEKIRKYLLLTIPYDEGWTVTVDQTEELPYLAMGNCMLIGLEPGEHVVEFQFVPRGLYEGLAITGVAAVLLAAGCIIVQIGKKKKHGQQES